MGGEPTWVWDRGQYDDLGRRLVELADRLVETVGVRSGGLADRAVIDLACGTGNVALAAADRGGRVTGVDLGAGLLTIAGETAGATDRDVTWLLADVTDTGLPDSSFDVALSSVGLIFVPERALAVAEVARLVRPGGWFGYTAWVFDPESPFFKPFAEVLPAGQNDGPARPWEWAVPDVIRAELGAEFVELEIAELMHEWAFADVDEAMHLIQASPMHVAAVLHVAPADRDRLDAAFERAFGALRGSDGVLRYRSPYVLVTARRRR